MAFSLRGFWRLPVSILGQHYHQHHQYISAVRYIKMSAQQRAKEVLDEMKEKNPYYDKYAEKIAKLQNSSPQEFLQRMDKVDSKNKPSKESKRLVFK